MDFIPILSLILTFNFHHFLAAENPTNPSETYIVHVKPGARSGNLETFYNSFLPARAADSDINPPKIVHHYSHAFSGFAAKLTKDDVEAMKQKPGFGWARPEIIYHKMTTHSPNFLGLIQNTGYWNSSGYGEGIVIGILDYGITPAHRSFNDDGMPPPPSWWNGNCRFKDGGCNKKLIGATFFSKFTGSPDDDDGHGTHTAGTAAGNFVQGANISGVANGTAAGIAPRAHLSVYKVCAPNMGCLESSIMAGMDAAIGDHVHIISVSLGAFSSVPLYQDTLAIASYKAMQQGILVVCAAGNSGPESGTVMNSAPWILTVGASTTDRSLSALIKLRSGVKLVGQTAYQPVATIQAALHVAGSANSESEFCDKFTNDVKDKIVACLVTNSIKAVKQGQNVKDAGGIGMILMNDETTGDTTNAFLHVLPAAHVNFVSGLQLKSYARSVGNPVATIKFNGTVFGDKRAPVVASFSSRGPYSVSPGIIKPDILGPGVDILAAWPPYFFDTGNTNIEFNLLSGTSMATPHLSGVAALIKASHPDWSPAAIKSAIMTTGEQTNLFGDRICDQTWRSAGYYDTGSGHVNPTKANDPGLIYDIEPDDYIEYLCGLNYSNDQVGSIAQKGVDCSHIAHPEPQLNLPSFSITFGPKYQTYTRAITNVGRDNSTYLVEMVPPEGVQMNVEPRKIVFSAINEKAYYAITFGRETAKTDQAYSEGHIRWTSGKYSVFSPIVAHFGP